MLFRTFKLLISVALIFLLAGCATTKLAPDTVARFSQDANFHWYLIKTSPKHSKLGLYSQPNGPFEVMLVNEDAAGTYLGVILYKVGSGDIWSFDNRFGQECKWAVDVTSFAWSPCGKYLYISTSGIYGTGCLYELNLLNKDCNQIYPKGKNSSPSKGTFKTEIININDKRIEFIVEYFDDIKKKSVTDLKTYNIP